MLELISRQEARRTGVKRYFTGNPCPYGHISERFVSTLACVECAKARKRGWATINRKKATEYRRKWAADNRERSREIKHAWNAAHPEGQKARSRKWYVANKAKADAASARWLEKNRDKRRAAVRNWQKNNRGRVTAAVKKRMADQLLRTPPWVDHEAIAAIYILAGKRRKSGEDVEVDHMIPLRGKRVSGLHVAENLQIIPSILNKRKSNSFQESL